MATHLQNITTIDNRTPKTLKLQRVSLPWGKWKDQNNFPPVDTIKPKSVVKAFHSSGWENTWDGTSGTVIYQFEDDPTDTITIYFNVPWAAGSHDEFSATAPNDKVMLQVIGFNASADVQDVTVKVGILAE